MNKNTYALIQNFKTALRNNLQKIMRTSLGTSKVLKFSVIVGEKKLIILGDMNLFVA